MLTEASSAVAQAFRLEQGELTSRFDTPDAIFIASTREIVAASTPAFEGIEQDVRAALIAERERSAALEAVNALIDRIGTGAETFEQAAARTGAAIETLPQAVNRSTASQSGIPRPIQQAMFSTQLGDTVSLPTGSPNMHVILTVDMVEPPSESMIAGLGNELTAAASATLGQDLVQALQSEITRSVKVRANEAALAAYKRSISEAQ
jgi:hypothetical protein